MSNLIHMKRLKAKKGFEISVKVGNVGIQINEDKAEYICRMLAHWLGFEIIEKHKVKRFDDVKSVQEEK